MSDMRFTYPSSISQLTEVNESFDSCMLRVCYTGRNRNNTIIPRKAIEEALPTMAYCPIVAHYEVQDDTIGGHDVDFIQGDNGELKMVNLTDAVGVIPANPAYTWESVTEKDGTVRDYLSVPAILWKRTPVYGKLKRDGVASQSMEIRVKDGRMVDEMFEIDSFDFTAFCLLGDDVEPCFESAQVAMFSMSELNSRLSEMMRDFKRTIEKVNSADADDSYSSNDENINAKGGECSLNVEELMKKYGLTNEDIDFQMEGLSAEELEQKFSEIHDRKFADGDNATETPGGESTGENTGNDTPAQTEPAQTEPAQTEPAQTEPAQEPETEEEIPDVNSDEEDDASTPPVRRQEFSLTATQLMNGLREALSSGEQIHEDWGDYPRYGYVDHDTSAREVYVYDNTDGVMYGMRYKMNGDNVVVDFESAKRKKISFVDFDEGQSSRNYAAMNTKMERMAEVMTELNEFKLKVEAERAQAAREAVFAKFSDLSENEQFIELQGNCDGMSAEALEEKCYAIRGRNVTVKFSQDNAKPIRLPVEHTMVDPNEPYGGVFREFGIGR